MVKPGVRVLLWGGTAVAVTIVASFAIAASVVAGGNVLSRDDVARALTPTPGTTTGTSTSTGTSTPTVAAPGTTDPTATRTTAAPSVDRMSSGVPGTVTVRCDGDVATLLSWSPNPGYRADDPVRGPAATVSVKFESDVAADFIVTATCAGGEPAIVQAAEPDDHGGGGGPGHG